MPAIDGVRALLADEAGSAVAGGTRRNRDYAAEFASFAEGVDGGGAVARVRRDDLWRAARGGAAERAARGPGGAHRSARGRRPAGHDPRAASRTPGARPASVARARRVPGSAGTRLPQLLTRASGSPSSSAGEHADAIRRASLPRRRRAASARRRAAITASRAGRPRSPRPRGARAGPGSPTRRSARARRRWRRADDRVRG